MADAQNPKPLHPRPKTLSFKSSPKHPPRFSKATPDGPQKVPRSARPVDARIRVLVFRVFGQEIKDWRLGFGLGSRVCGSGAEFVGERASG